MCFNFQKALTTCNSRTQHTNYMQSNAHFSKTALFMWFIMIMHDCKKQCVEKKTLKRRLVLTFLLEMKQANKHLESQALSFIWT